MRLKIGIGNKGLCANSGAIYDKMEFRTDSFKFFEAHVPVDFATSSQEALGEIIEVGRCIH